MILKISPVRILGLTSGLITEGMMRWEYSENRLAETGNLRYDKEQMFCAINNCGLSDGEES